MKNYAEILFVDAVRELQDQDGVSEKFATAYSRRTQDAFEEEDLKFINERRSFYIASVSTSGWPYVQHRGGPPGFLKAIGPARLGFADYIGNRQYVTMGHVARDNRVSLILTDYENRDRLKLLGRLTMVAAEDADPALVEQLSTTGEGRIQRIVTIDIEAMDWNCPKYIPRLVEAERLEELKAENERLRRQLGMA